MEPVRFTTNELIYYGAIAGAIIGLVLGIIILILGFVKKERSYGVFGFLGSVILGPISGILSLIVFAIFIWLILRKPKNIVDPPADNDSSVQVVDSENN